MVRVFFDIFVLTTIFCGLAEPWKRRGAELWLTLAALVGFLMLWFSGIFDVFARILGINVS